MRFAEWILPRVVFLCAVIPDCLGINLTATPSIYPPGGAFEIRCDLGSDLGNIVDVLMISIGLDSTILAGISDQQPPDMANRLKTRGSVSGELNHTNVLESYLAMSLNITTCSDLGEFTCRMNVQTGIIVHAVSTSINYTIDASLEDECSRLTTPTPASSSTTSTTTSPTSTSSVASGNTSSGWTPHPNLFFTFCTLTIGILSVMRVWR